MSTMAVHSNSGSESGRRPKGECSSTPISYQIINLSIYLSPTFFLSGMLLILSCQESLNANLNNKSATKPQSPPPKPPQTLSHSQHPTSKNSPYKTPPRMPASGGDHLSRAQLLLANYLFPALAVSAGPLRRLTHPPLTQQSLPQRDI